ncbi:NAD(P)/FAD-dependent oxidoreductase [Paracoccus sp. SCSIO 75233]|uniref:NAD(P)/FAD-dependent oxidoreductase n=1 Tax=Paracoccus sp. SCSIO 75233 TaxID=3017782 RepID=UPI0022F13AE7|nr:FAD-dependent oxidoreductase [Paracoccus sp. SCSIO 75233]WBU53967.1 FAD-dependent oxidoreductase [Paracoccus sp. SCSIO 75233]
MNNTGRRRIAIIGSGISGLGAAWLLDPHHDITLFEAAPRAGGHARTVRAEGVDVDTGFIVCNRRTYPLFIPLLEKLGVPLEPSDMSFSASFGGGRYEYGTFSTRAMFAQPMCLMDAGHWRLIRDILRFFRHAPSHQSHQGSIGELIRSLRLGDEFRDRFLLPISGAIWSTPPADMMKFPAGTFVRFFDNHGLLSVKGQPQWLTITGGSRRYVDAILSGLRGKVRLSSPVHEVRRGDESVTVVSPRGAEQFDRVIFATHAPQALATLERPDRDETAILGAMRTQPNRMVLHSDPRLMPRRRSAWASWNYVTQNDMPATDRPISLSYWMNRLQNLTTPRPLIVTLNPEIEPMRIHDEAVFAHPQFDAAAISAQGRLHEIQGRGGVYYAGAWTRYGFHEDGLLSALRVAQALGVEWPLGPDPWTAPRRIAA